MAIPNGAKQNFETLKAAAANGDLALMECRDTRTGEMVDVICAVMHDGREYQFVPFGHMPRENPYERYVPPTTVEG